MPIYKNNEFIERVYKGTEPLRRVYKNNELLYGLYDINYHNLLEDYAPSNNEITKYAWGKTRNIAPTEGNTDFDDYFLEYRNHWFGWYDDTNYEEKRPDRDDQYIVEKEEHTDLDLYAKWKQKKFSYQGFYTINTSSYNNWSYTSEGNVPFTSLYDIYGASGKIPASYMKNENGTWRTGWNAGHENSTTMYSGSFRQCVWWAFGRTWEISGEPEKGLPNVFRPPKSDGTEYPWGFVNGGQVFNITAWQKLGGQDQLGVNISDKIRPGDIITWSWNQSTGLDTSYSGPGHIAIVELVTDEKVYYSESGLSISSNANPARMSSRKRSDFEVGKYLYTVNYGESSYKVHFQGVIYNPYTIPTSTEISGTTENNYSTTTEFSGDCEDQNNPEIPEMYITGEGIKPEDQENPGEIPPLASKGTLWNGLEESWYTRSGGWYNYNASYPGQCTWGANGRTGQMRNGANAAPKGNVGTSWNDANYWLTPSGHGGNWSSTLDWTEVQVGDCILYGCTTACEADDGSGTIPVTSGNHVVVVEEVLGDGKFKVSSWNYSVNATGPDPTGAAGGGNHRFFGYYTETHLPGEGANHTSGSVAGYLINHIDKATGGTTHYEYSSTYEYITSERQFDYNENDWTEWEVVDISDENWKFDWEED